MPLKKRVLKVSLIVLIAIWVIAFFIGLSISWGNPRISLADALGAMNWPILIIILVLIIINTILYIKAKD